MSDLRIVLAVPLAGGSFDQRTFERWRKTEHIDLVVFPENYLFTSARRSSLGDVSEACIEGAEQLANDLGLAVLTGVWCDDAVSGRGMQCAAFWNPAPRRGETREHFYAKHSTSRALPYELPDYDSLRDRMFEPIALGGRKLGVQLCHDQFFGLVSAKLERAGADTLFDLTGDSVVRSKWMNVIMGRTLERPFPYFCTMSRRARETSNIAFSVGMRDGREIVALKKSESRERGDLTLYDVGGKLAPFKLTQDYSPKSYDELTIALAPSKAKANVPLPTASSKKLGKTATAWRELRVGPRRLGILELPLEEIGNPLCIHEHEQLDSPFDAHLVCFVTDADVDAERAVALARLRAIEHRTGIALCARNVREVLKSSRYKNIQRVAERPDGTFGIELDFMSGTYAGMGKTAGQGIPPEYQDDYRRLLEPARAAPVKQKRVRSRVPIVEPNDETEETFERDEDDGETSAVGRIAFALGKLVGTAAAKLTRK